MSDKLPLSKVMPHRNICYDVPSRMNRIYLDHAATTPTDPLVVEAMKPLFTEMYGNPSSVHSSGSEARESVDAARSILAESLNCRAEEIFFTSGGTESNNLALKGIAWASEDRGNHIITSAVEHHAVLEPCDFLEKREFHITRLPVDADGRVDPAEVKSAIRPETTLISIMHANNEIGTIQPIQEIGALARENNIPLHVDAVQTFGHLPIAVDEMGIDLLSVSAHKLYGPKGVGALYVRRGTRIESLLHGGNQERGLRASTENVPSIVGFGRAVEIAARRMSDEHSHLRSLQQEMIRGILDKIPHTRLNGHADNRLPSNVNVSFEGVSAEAVLLGLDLEGIAASSGSACATGVLEPSHVLLALGLSKESAEGSLRFTMGRNTTEAEIDTLLDVLPGIVERLRSVSPLY